MRLAVISLVSLLASCVGAKQDEANVDDQISTYKSWVLSRCLTYTLKNEQDKQDALNTASAYLEISNLPVEMFISSEPLIQEFVGRTYQGSIPGTFNVKKCIDLFNSDELDDLYRELNQ